MTPRTDAEQEREEFLEQVGHLIMDGTIETRSTKRAGISFACGNLHAAFMVWRAARRAPAAPVPQSEPVAYLWQHCETGRTRVVLPDMVVTADANWIVVGPLYLAAAPRPPVAAPVKLPEPFTTLVRKNSWAPNSYEAAPRSNHQDYGRQWADERINVFTEQQVRDLLAAHGIQEQST